VVANATTKAFTGTNAWNFLTDGWFGRPAAGSGNSWTLSASELVKGIIDPSSNSGMTDSFASGSGLSGAVTRNLREHGAMSLATVALAPVVAKGIKRLARKPISDLNRWVFKPLGMGVKI
jgi:hypothetical protein